MPTSFIVTTRAETPKLWISQRPLEEIHRALRAWPYSHTHRQFIFDLRVLPNNGNQFADPTGCSSLALVGRMEPENEAEHYRFALGHAIENLPQEQAQREIQTAIDHLEKLRHRVEPDLAKIDSTGS